MGNKTDEIKAEIRRSEKKREELRQGQRDFEREISEHQGILHKERLFLDELEENDVMKLSDIRNSFADYEETMKDIRSKSEKYKDETVIEVKRYTVRLEEKEQDLKEKLRCLLEQEKK